jgi:hypothetical protein
MKKFSIEISKVNTEKSGDVLWAEGKIIINDYEEDLSIPIQIWNLNDYQQQWREGIERLKTKNSSCLVTAVRMLKTGLPCMEIWKLYRVGDTVFVNHQLLGGDIFKKIKGGRKPYYLKTCYQLVDERLTNENGEGITEYGQKMFELSLNIKDLDQLKFNE